MRWEVKILRLLLMNAAWCCDGGGGTGGGGTLLLSPDAILRRLLYRDWRATRQDGINTVQNIIKHHHVTMSNINLCVIGLEICWVRTSIGIEGCRIRRWYNFFDDFRIVSK